MVARRVGTAVYRALKRIDQSFGDKAAPTFTEAIPCMRVVGAGYISNYVTVWVSELHIEQTRCSLRAEVMLLKLTTPCSDFFSFQIISMQHISISHA
jgi:hypothetical protein